MQQVLYLHVIVVIAIIVEGETLKRSRGDRTVQGPVYIEINPGILRSKDLIKFDSKNKRIKRGKNNGKPSLILQITPDFFTNPKLQNIYSTITGINDNSTEINADDIKNEETKLIFQINPLMLPGVNLKRETEEEEHEIQSENNVVGGQAAFSLKIRPVLPRKLPSVREFKDRCMDKVADEIWCKSHVEYSKCPATEPTICTTTKCMPTFPDNEERSNNLPHMCRINWEDHIGSPNPCQECSSTTVECATEFTMCKSSPPPTVMPTYPSEVCRTTYCKHVTKTSPTTPEIKDVETIITQSCDTNAGYVNLIEGKPGKYFILVKRSPLGSWSRTFRKKRENPYKKYKYYLVPLKK